MRLSTRKLLDKSFSGLGFFSLLLMCAALAVILIPIVLKGSSAFIFKETVERREFMLENYDRGDADAIQKELARAKEARKPVYEILKEYEESLGWGDLKEREKLKDIKDKIRNILGPLPGDAEKPLPRDQYGQTRWDRAQAHLDDLLCRTEYKFPDPNAMGVPVKVARKEDYKGTPLAPLFDQMENNLDKMLRPQWTFYWRFLFDMPSDSYFFGGIWPSVLGTIYLAFGSMIIAAPVGVISAIYLTQYAGDGPLIRLLRTCISTLAGVPSIVFGLFGLAFFIHALHVSKGPSVLVGCLTLAALVLPTIIRASEEAIKAVPRTYKEASLSLGATRWRTIVKVLLPAALPGIITSIIISVGRAAGETAPILFTAAVMLGDPLTPMETLSQPSPALPANLYALVAVHEAVEEVRHVQFGMALTLIVLVLLLNLAAVVLRARISKKLRT